MEYIDIHNHTLFGVDDGPKDIKQSMDMLREAESQGIRGIIFTPHFRYGMFPYTPEDVEQNFKELEKQAKAEQIGIEMYLGCEYHVNGEIVQHIQDGRVHTLADTEYVLTEYSHSSSYADMKRYTHELLAAGYQPVIAHMERYACIADHIQYAKELSEMGAWIQINADSTLGIDGKYLEKVCKKLLKLRVVDIVASDAHGTKDRSNHMDRCYQYICKKFGESYAADLFYTNPKLITDIGR